MRSFFNDLFKKKKKIEKSHEEKELKKTYSKVKHNSTINDIPDPNSGTGHVFTGKDIIIKSKFNLMATATKKREENSRLIKAQENTVWTPFGREKINEAYLQAGIALRAQQKAEREADPEWMAHDAVTKELGMYSHNRHKNFWHLEAEDAVKEIKKADDEAMTKSRLLPLDDREFNKNIYYCTGCYPVCRGHRREVE